jgi:hypothetical protein
MPLQYHAWRRQSRATRKHRRAAKMGCCKTGTAGLCRVVVMEIHRHAPTRSCLAAAERMNEVNEVNLLEQV